MRIGIDLGGTKIEAAALDPDGNIVYRQRQATPQGDYQATLAAIHNLVEEIEARLLTSATVGVGIPGSVSPASGLIRNANSTCLIGRPLQADLEQLLQREVRLANDADCFALSEAVDGAAAGANIVFGVILGTGVGGGIVIRQQLLDSANRICGEWGHNPLPWPDDDERPGPPCYCGKHGCIETFLSGPGLSFDYAQAISTRTSYSAKEIVQLAENGEPAASQALARYQRRLAKSLASVINILDPDVIVLGGGTSNIRELYTAIPALWHEYIFSDAVATRLTAPLHGDSSGVRGAAWLWPG